MAGARTILATAFEPFGGETINASWEAVRLLEGAEVGGGRVFVARLPCAYDLAFVTFRARVLALKSRHRVGDRPSSRQRGDPR